MSRALHASRPYISSPYTLLRSRTHPISRCQHQSVSLSGARRAFSSASVSAANPSRQRSRSSGFYVAFLAANCAVGIALYGFLGDLERLDTWRLVAPPDQYLNPNMPDATAPGRIGNLTIDEQIKLQETWRRLAHICNMSLDEDDDGDDAANDTLTPTSTAAGSTPAPETNGKGKKSRKPKLFRRKSSAVKLDKAEEDDKYGQTKEFQQALKDNTPEDIRDTVWMMVKMDHPDALMLRFLRARKWDIDKALVMMISTMNWRKRDMHIEDTIVREGERVAFKSDKTPDDDGFMGQYRAGKSFLHGVDRNGRPICIVRARLHHPGQETLKSLEDYTVHTIETARMTLRDPVDTATLIFDMTDFSIRNMDNKPVQFMIKCFEANYPESLGMVAVHNAPWVFQGIWKLIRGWLDPVVASKINFTNSVEDLEAFIPRQNILKEFGGDDAWEYEYKEPDPKENERLGDSAERDRIQAERKALVEAYEAKTRRWLRYAPVEPEFATYNKERDELAEKLRVNYWQLDPYIRARTLYDRTGIIGEGGKIDFYPYRSKDE